MSRLKIVLTVLGVAVVGSLVLASVAPAGDFADEPCIEAAGTDTFVCPPGTAGSPYAVDIKLKEPWPNCTEFRVTSGNFPPGLTVSDEGNIRGTPTTAGSYTFYLTVYWKSTGGCVSQNESDRRFTINVGPQVQRLVVTTNSIPEVGLNQAYSTQLTAGGGTVSSWSLASGTLPTGLTLGSNGVISGTPTQSGSFTFTVQANGSPNSDTRQLTLFVSAPLELQSLAGAKPPETGWTSKAAVNAPLTTGVKAVGGRAPYAYTSTGALPPGIALNPTTGALTGAGTTAGKYATTITVTDGTGAKASVAWKFNILPLLAFSQGKVLPVGQVDRLYSARIPVTGKDARTAQFALSGKIPPGLELDETTGRLTGTLLKAGSYRLRVYAFPANGAPISKIFRITVRA